MANRHDVIIWDASEYKVENNYHQAVHQARALARQKAEPSDVLLCFVSDLKNHSQDETLEPAVIEYLQQIEDKFKASNTAALVLALPEYESHWRSIMEIVIEEISMYRLVLCDESLKLVFLPDFSILSPDSPKSEDQPLIKSDTFPVELKQFHEIAKTKIESLFTEHGFMLTEEVNSGNEFYISFDRNVNMGKLKISISYQGDKSAFYPVLHLSIIEYNIISIAKKTDFSYPMIDYGVFFNILELYNISDEFYINNWKKFEELLFLLKSSVLQWSNTIADIKDIDALFNGNMDVKVKHYIHSTLNASYALIVARLANNPNFEELALNLGAYGPDSGRAWGRFGYSDVAVAWPKLVNYLRDNIKPLSDWPKHFVLPPYIQENELQVLVPNDQKTFPTTITKFDEILENTLEKLLIEHGLIIVDRSYSSDNFEKIYEKEFNNGKFFLAINCEKKNSFILAINFRIIEKNMITISQKTDFKYSMANGGGIFFNLNGVLQLKKLICINSHQKLEELSILLQTSILKWSDAIYDINSIDALINGETDETIKKYVHSSVYAPYALIIARLANNPNFDELAVSLGTYGANSGRAWGKFSHSQVAEAWPKLVQYLRDEVKPLV